MSKKTLKDYYDNRPQGRVSITGTDACTGDVLFSYEEDDNIVVNNAKEALINAVISSSPSYRLANIVAGNDIGDGTKAHHIVDMNNVASGDTTGLANDSTTYSIDINYNNTTSTLNVQGQNAQTFGDLVSELDGQVSNGSVSIDINGDILMEADSNDPEELLFFIEDTDELFLELNGFIGFNEPVNESNPDDPIAGHTLATQSNNSTIIYDPSDYSNTNETTFGTRGSTEIIINRVFRGEEVLSNLGYDSSESVKFTSMVITTGNNKAFAYKRFPRLSLSSTVNINVVWYVEFP